MIQFLFIRRNTLACKIDTPFGAVECYSCHLELFCGILDRVCIVSEILKDVFQRQNEVKYQALLGDFNTLAHGIARLSPHYCKDFLRWRSIGSHEAEWWEDNIFSFHVEDGPKNTNLLGYGLPNQVLIDARNPGFIDPFHPTKDITLVNYKGWFTGKLDWVLLKGFGVVSKNIGNHDFSASDHKWMMVDVSFTTLLHETIKKKKKQRKKKKNYGILIILLAVVLIAVFFQKYFN